MVVEDDVPLPPPPPMSQLSASDSMASSIPPPPPTGFEDGFSRSHSVESLLGRGRLMTDAPPPPPLTPVADNGAFACVRDGMVAWWRGC